MQYVGIRMEFEWNMRGIYEAHVWNMYGTCVESAWTVYGMCRWGWPWGLSCALFAG